MFNEKGVKRLTNSNIKFGMSFGSSVKLTQNIRPRRLKWGLNFKRLGNSDLAGASGLILP